METESERGAVQRPADFHVGRQGETFLVEIFGRRFPHILPQAAAVLFTAPGECCEVPSGKHTKNYGKIHHFQWENPLFLWSFSIAILT